MLRYATFLRLIVIALAVWGIAFPGHAAQKSVIIPAGTSQEASKTAPASKPADMPQPTAGKSAIGPGAAIREDMALSIVRLYAEAQRLRVVIQNNDSRKINATLVKAVGLKLSSGSGDLRADLRLSDLIQKTATRVHANTADLDTGLTMMHTERVTAILYAGKWQTRHAMLVTVPNPPMVGGTASAGQTLHKPKRPRQPTPVAGTTAAGRIRQPTAPMAPANELVSVDRPQPASPMRIHRAGGSAAGPTKALTDSGIRIERPSEATHVLPGEPLRVQYRFTRTAPAGDITFELVDGAYVVARTTRPYAPPASGEPDDTLVTFTWLLPADLASGRNYLIIATRETVYGVSDNFAVGLDTGSKPLRATPEPTAIQVRTPRTGALTPPAVIRDFETDITWTMPDAMSLFTCPNRVNLYAVRQADGERTRIQTNVDCDEGNNAIRWRPDRYMTPGRYRVRVEAGDGCFGESGTFRIDGCDYGIESVTLEGVGSLATGIDVRDSATVTGTFEVRVRWNGIPVPPNLPPGTTWDNRLTVLSARTGDNITHPAEGASFTYRDRPATDGILLVRVPFSFPRDEIPAMRHGRHLPLEFRLQPFGASIDSDAANNTFNAELRVLGATDNDLRIAIYPSDFSLTRGSHSAWAAPVWHCTFNQEVSLTNLAVTDAGGPAGTLAAVPCRWEMQYRDDGASDFHTIESGSFTVEHVSGGAWTTRNIEGHFDVNPDRTDRAYRLMVIADPDQTLLDPDRNNNRATVPFRLPD